MNKSEKAAVNEFVSLVGGRTWERTSHRCTGKWRGTTDYGFVIDGRVTFYVSNGMSYFERRVREWSKAIRTFRTKKDYFLRLLYDQVERDNAKATAEGLHRIRLVDIGILTPESDNQNDFFSPFALIEVGEKQFKHRTTNLGLAIVLDNLESYLKECNKKIYTAGAVDSPDYIFCGVRFNSSDGLYKICVSAKNQEAMAG